MRRPASKSAPPPRRAANTAHSNLGVALDEKGQIDEAIHQLQEALRLKPDDADARRNLDVALATKGDSAPPPGASTNG